uniref:Craniofacial development protein 2 n=1 Tax=Cacopsylla melanoneura TaxID=428564 RepID=A0A8D8QVD8_9HEMI
MILTNTMAKCISNFVPVSERIMLVQFHASPININIIQVYAPTTDHADEEIDELYNSINDVIKTLKKQDVLVIMGDFNAKIGKGRTSDFVGPFGLGERNDRGDNLEIFAETHHLAIMNTWFKQPPRRLYTWKAPKDKPDRIIRNQIDYILVNKRFRNGCIAVRTYPGADIHSDHVPLIGTFKFRMKRVVSRKEQKWDMRKLKDPTVRDQVKKILNKDVNERSELNIETEIGNFKQVVEEAKEKHLQTDRRKKKSWMTDEILELMDQRRRNKNNNTEYKRIHTLIRKKIIEQKKLKKRKNEMRLKLCKEGMMNSTYTVKSKK